MASTRRVLLLLLLLLRSGRRFPPQIAQCALERERNFVLPLLIVILRRVDAANFSILTSIFTLATTTTLMIISCSISTRVFPHCPELSAISAMMSGGGFGVGCGSSRYAATTAVRLAFCWVSVLLLLLLLVVRERRSNDPHTPLLPAAALPIIIVVVADISTICLLDVMTFHIDTTRLILILFCVVFEQHFWYCGLCI